MDSESHKTRMLWLCGILHVFTHIYHVALLPLYLLIQKDLNLASVERATLLVTVLMISYYLPSYPMGVLADSVSRKKLLGVGLIINGLGFVALAQAQSYAAALACVIVTGIGGSFYHPAATALVARVYPVGTGKALGLVGIGASVGFFLSPIYTGWRAEVTGNWRTPVFELGVAGVICAIVFMCLAQEVPSTKGERRRGLEKMFPTPALWMFFLSASFALSMRDFTGSSMGSLGSLFVQQAHGYNIKQTGLALSGIFLASSISNPLFGGLSDRGRIRSTFQLWKNSCATVSRRLLRLPRMDPEAVITVLFRCSIPSPVAYGR
jgi:MFS family permease